VCHPVVATKILATWRLKFFFREVAAYVVILQSSTIVASASDGFS
jgi:hypothetical protein